MNKTSKKLVRKKFKKKKFSTFFSSFFFKNLFFEESLGKQKEIIWLLKIQGKIYKNFVIFSQKNVCTKK